MSSWTSTIDTRGSRVRSALGAVGTHIDCATVMRACEGCRRRKIKCDAATTNTWPCAACTRLKLTCIPPTVSYEKDSTSPGVHMFEVQPSPPYPTISVGTIGEYQQQQPLQHYVSQPGMQQAVPVTYSDMPSYQTAQFIQSPQSDEVLQYQAMMPANSSAPEHGMTGMSASYPLPQAIPPPPVSERSWTSEPGLSNLTDVLGDLQINSVATGMFSLSPLLAFTCFC
jgi:hypothetical protein